MEEDWAVEYGLEGPQGIKISAWQSRKLKIVTRHFDFMLGCCETKGSEYAFQQSEGNDRIYPHNVIQLCFAFCWSVGDTITGHKRIIP